MSTTTRDERLTKYELARIWLKQHTPRSPQFRLAEAQTEIKPDAPMDFDITGMPRFYGPVAGILACGMYFLVVVWLNVQVEQGLLWFEPDALEKLSILAILAGAATFLIVGWMGIFMQTGTFTRYICILSPIIWRDPFRNVTFPASFRVIERRRHYPRKRVNDLKKRLRDDALAREAVLEMEAEEAPITTKNEPDAIEALWEVLE